MKRLIAICIVIITATTAQAKESPYKTFGRNFATGAYTGALCASIPATLGAVCLYQNLIENPKLQWGIKTAAGLLSLYVIGTETYDSIDQLRNTYLQCDELIMKHTSKAVAAKLYAKRETKKKDLKSKKEAWKKSTHEALKPNPAPNHIELANNAYLEFYEATRAFNYINAKVARLKFQDPEDTRLELEKLTAPADKSTGQQQAKPEILLLKSKAWGYFTGFGAALAGITVCYKTGWLSSFWK